MALIDRQHFLLRLLNDPALREDFFSSHSNEFGLSEEDYAILRQLDAVAVVRKARGLGHITEH